MQNDKEDKKDKSDYRDNPKEFAQSSDYAQRGTTGQYSGGGPGDSSVNYGGGDPGSGRQGGSQEEWRGKPAGADDDDPQNVAGVANDRGPGSGGYGDVESRSADPGQSSFGGFKGEGSAPREVGQQKIDDDASVGGQQIDPAAPNPHREDAD